MADAVEHQSAGPPFVDPLPEDDHGSHAHNPYLAHHFDTPAQQFDSGKQGMWLFLATEILLFGGLFCAYAVYRGNHPEIFHEGHQHLNAGWGALNTVVLLISSFTMAWAVRCAQVSNQAGLKLGLIITLICGAGFMVIKAIEYTEKYQHGYLWGRKYSPHPEGHNDGHHSSNGAAGGHAAPAAGGHGAEAPHAPSTAPADTHDAATHAAGHAPAEQPAGTQPAAAGGGVIPADPLRYQADRSTVKPAAIGPTGVVHTAEAHASHGHADNVQMYFSVYFALTGLHGVHVLAGMTVIAWLLYRAFRGDFSSQYYTPVDLGGLYWHLVDLIWIYLFPLLYLIE